MDYPWTTNEMSSKDHDVRVKEARENTYISYDVIENGDRTSVN